MKCRKTSISTIGLEYIFNINSYIISTNVSVGSIEKSRHIKRRGIRTFPAQNTSPGDLDTAQDTSHFAAIEPCLPDWASIRDPFDGVQWLQATLSYCN